VTILTSQTIHARTWMACPRCDGGKAFTARDIKQGATCTYCDGKGEIPRHSKPSVWAGYSTYYERQAGA
jgi:DnaJ-class molecular chaperone